MESSGGLRASLAGRYAAALFDLAEERKSVREVEESLDRLRAAMDESEELRALTGSPVLSRATQADAIAGVAQSLDLHPLVRNVLGVMAANRRLAKIPAMLRAFSAMASAHRGEIEAEVVSAHPLDDAQLDSLRAQLRKRVGSEVSVSTRVDPDILGGLVVKIGSQMIDSSIRTRLNSLSQAMKG